jgi:hypothetical protein
MKKKIMFFNLLTIVLVLFFAGCAMPGVEKQPGDAGDALDSIQSRAAGPTQYPKVYDIEISGSELESAYLGSMVWTGSEYGIVWRGRTESDGHDYVYFTRMNRDGVKTAVDIKVSSKYTFYEPSIAWSGYEYGVAWQYKDDLYFARIQSGKVVSGSLKKVTNSLQNNAPSLIWTGNQFAIAWVAGQHADQHVYFATISINGDVSDAVSVSGGTAVFLSGGMGDRVGIVYNKYDNEYGVVYREENGNDEYVYFETINSSGKVLSRKKISKAQNCSLAWNDSSKKYAVAWSLQASGTEDTKIYFTTFSRNGEMEEKYKLASGRSPQITWNADDNAYGICWKYNEDKKLGFLEVKSGKAPDTDAISKMTFDGPVNMNVTTCLLYNKNNNRYAVTWDSWDKLNKNASVYFMQFKENGTKSAQGKMNGKLKGTQPGYYLIRSISQEDYLTTFGSDVYHSGYYYEYPSCHLWELYDDDNNGTFELVNHGCGRTLACTDVRVGGILSMEKKDVGDYGRWYLYSYDDGTYLLRLAYNDDYRVYAYDSTVKLSTSASGGKKFELIPWGY